MEKPTRLALLKDVAEFLNEETEMKSMLDGALQSLISGSDFSTGWIFFINQHGEHELVSDYHLPGALLKCNCAYMKEGSCWCVQSYENGKLTKASNIINCSRINQANQVYYRETDDITHHATVPLRSGEEQFGLLNVATPNTVSYSDEDLELLESVAFQIGSAIKRITLTEQEKEAARLSERNRLARDLHDSVNQMLFSVKVTAHAGQELKDIKRAQQTFGVIEQTTQKAVNEMRALIWQLKPVGLEHGLIHALHEYSEMLNLQLQTEVEGLINLSSTIEEHIYRILQEAVNNVKKHTDSNQVVLKLSQISGILSITVTDKGRGFDTNQINDIGSHGINNMWQRAQMLNAKFNVTSDRRGTQVSLQVPLDQQ
ncbi:GAF domain-containing sensor histidine kinase [Staphylococcus sp. SQ8-PEA]|uniref:histidine kinase n=1 Tax=Staphylococcus marylandisciuri TaxID=2981529 RepID=A0ABT2QS25_9STAP|nr:GAF domain-containing sensor histidine kinase [Staphylococcus marylandisciuri]MCU5746796.1 GAF domain-containing sensor histidine kinase [Staphylococcus marylandisciuri]